MNIKRDHSWFKWLGIASRFASIQSFTQAMMFLLGIIIIRSLSKQEYAVYTLANTMLGAILVLADSGIGSSMTSIGGKVWQDTRALGELLASSMYWRRYLAITTLVLVVPVMALLLLRLQSSTQQIVAVVLLVLFGSAFEFLTRMYAVVLRLRSERGRLQWYSACGVAVRAVLLLAFWFKLNAVTVLIGTSLSYGVQWLLLRYWTKDVRQNAVKAVDETVHKIGAIIKKQAPNTLFYCVQAQVSVWIISIYGHSTVVAEVGALGRLAALVTILNTTLSEVIYPAFARIQSPSRVLLRYSELLLLHIVGGAILVGLFTAFPHAVLWLLGSKYSNLSGETTILGISISFGIVSALVWGLNNARAWILYPWPMMIFVFSGQYLMASHLNLGLVHNALIFSIVSTLIMILWGFVVSWSGLAKEGKIWKAHSV